MGLVWHYDHHHHRWSPIQIQLLTTTTTKEETKETKIIHNLYDKTSKA